MGSSVIPRFWAGPPGTYSGIGQNEDPIASLIGKGLAAFGAVRTARQQEADRQERLQTEAARESDTRDFRNQTLDWQMLQGGFTRTPPPPTTSVSTPTGSTVADMAIGGGQAPQPTVTS